MGSTVESLDDECDDTSEHDETTEEQNADISNEKEDDPNEVNTCPVCLQPLTNDHYVIELGCSHKLCSKCFKSITKCPMCRNSADVFYYEGKLFEFIPEPFELYDSGTSD